MNIAMIGQKGIPAIHGGVEKHVHELSVRLVQAGHNVAAYSRAWYTPKTTHAVDGVQVIHTPTIQTKHFDAIIHTFTSTIHAMMQGFDVIHYHGVGPALLSWMPRVFSPKTRVVTTFHSIDRHHQKWNWFAKIMLRMGEWAAVHFAHETITISRSIQHYVLTEFGVETSYIPNAVLPVSVTDDKELGQFGIAKNEYLVMISRLVKHKAAHILIDAFIDMKNRYPDNAKIQGKTLVIVGGSAQTDEYVAALHEQAKGRDDIVFTGFQSGEALDQLYAHADALVHPSLNEGLPITVLQAMNLAKPTLLSDIPEHLELMRDTKTVFAQNDVSAMSEAMANYIVLPASEKEALGKRNKQIINKEYTWDVTIDKIINTYHRGSTILATH